MSRTLLCSFLFIILAASGVAYAGVFDIGEIRVAPSPAQERYLQLKHTEKVLDFDVAKDGPQTAILMENQTGGAKVVFWDPGRPSEIMEEWPVPKGFTPRALAWRPAAKGFFLAGKQGSEYVILRVDRGTGGWASKPVYRSAREIRRLVPAPRPFEIEADYSGDKPRITNAYRIFFGLKNPDGTYSIKSVTEDGKREYQAVGPAKGFTTFKDAPEQPSRIEAPSALPLAFHPAGHVLLWEDENRGFQYALYEIDHWGKSVKLSYPQVSGGTLTPTPNGLALIHWSPGFGGVTLVSMRGKKRELLASQYNFLSTPSSVPDGRGIVGLINTSKGPVLVYLPLSIPLADVANAWMFAEQREDQQLYSKSGGLLRDLPDDQLYSVYESEAYNCGAYDRSTPTRPYLVTTDLFWELFAAAYEGVFIIEERRLAIPAFWEFVREAESYFRRAKPDSPWTLVFSTLANMGKAPGENENVAAELQLIQKAGGREFSPVLGKPVDYGELKPRGHYNSSEAMKTYFKAFKYLTSLAGEALPLDDPENMPPELKAMAHSWVAAYNFFIAPPRSPVFCEDTFEPPPFARHPLQQVRLFPLSWGVDNEVLLSTVFHEDWPVAEQVKGPSGPRLLPSGLDIASALGSGLATALLSSEIEKYPPLRKTLENLRVRLAKAGKGAGDEANLYNRWIAALALQWADDVAPPGASPDQELWRAKRLQTGLASWATLRHATVLVNERTSAECGEAGFEPILLTPPRGYVEPDPRTFDAIGALFRSMEQRVKSWAPSPKDTIRGADDEQGEALREGVIRRLSETAAKAGLFKTVAEKEIKGKPLSNREYEEILLIGRIAEHHFLIFKSLASEQLALSNPDPMPKIADVAGGGPLNLPFLMAAVGRPMEWDHIVPYFGRKQIVKGAVYSYYEFSSERLMNDREWLESLASRQHPEWISAFVSGSSPACPPRNPY